LSLQFWDFEQRQ